MTNFETLQQEIPEPYRENPWLREHLKRALAIEDEIVSAHVLAVVLADYQGHEHPAGACPCGEGQFWYRATTGGHKCPACGAFADRDGTVLGIPAREAASV